MAALTRYADDRARYDATYIRDAYESVEAASSQFKLPPNTTWPGVATALQDVRACLSIDANTTCKITPDARDAFGNYASKLRLQVAMASDVVEAFSSEAEAYQKMLGRVVAPRDGLEVGRRLRYFPRPPTFSFLDCGRALSPRLAPPDGRRLRLRGVL